MQVKVQTSQNVYIHYELASLGARIGAYLIDGLIIVAYVIAALIGYFQLFSSTEVWVLMILYIPVMIYHLTSELLMDGQSIGKKQLYIKVIKLDGTQPSLGSYLLRWILRPVDFLFYGAAAILCIVIGGKGQRLGDLAAGTTVINTKKKPVMPNKNIVKEGIDEDYKPIFREANRLSERDVQIIMEVLTNYRKSGEMRPVTMLADKTEKLLGVSSGLPPVKFLHTVVKDYTYLTANA